LQPDAAAWLAVVPVLAKAADGSLAEPDARAVMNTDKETARRLGLGDLQRLLGGVASVLAGRPDLAVESLRKVAKSESVDRLRTFATLAWAGQLYGKGRIEEAAAKTRGLSTADNLPGEVRFNLALMQSGGAPEAVKRVIASFASANLPAALFCQAVLLDRSGRGEAAL